MSIKLNDSIRVQGGKPVEDKRLNNGVVYNSVLQANTLIAKTDRYPTLEVAIKIGGATFIYWYKEDIENSDLVLKQEGGGDGGTIESYIEITKFELDSHIANSTLKPGVLYGIKETERWMLLGDSTDTLFLRAVSTNQLEIKGTGKFFVPKYNQNIDGYGIWKGEIYGAFPTTVPKPVYAINDRVIWGGRLWSNVSGKLGTKVDIYTLSSDWEAIPFNETDYNVRFDKIEYDYQKDTVIYRKDGNGNEISTSYGNWQDREFIIYGGDSPDEYSLATSFNNSLKVYQWGNEYNINTGKGCGYNIITNSILECLNTCGSIYANTLENNGNIYSNILKNNGSIYSNTLKNFSSISFNTLENYKIIYSNDLNNFSEIGSNTLKNGQITNNTLKNGQITNNTLQNGQITNNTLNSAIITSNTLENGGAIDLNTLNNSSINLRSASTINGKKIQYLTINRGNIGGNTGIDLSSATVVYANFTREVFQNSAGVTKIKYFNENDVLVITDITD